jgi:hypothetical protein
MISRSKVEDAGGATPSSSAKQTDAFNLDRFRKQPRREAAGCHAGFGP